jgi:hypothetical protein
MFELISKAVVAVSLAIGSWFVPVSLDIPAVDPSIENDRVANRVAQLESQVENLGAYNPTGGGTYRLKTSIGTTNTTITLSSFKEPVSLIPYTMAYLNTTVGYGTLDPVNSARSEFISFTGITQNADGSATLTGVTRGLSRSYPYTASSTMRQAHGGQSIFILSDSPQHFSEYAVKQNNETITGQWTFSVFPITASSSFATETVAGWVELATGTEAASSTASGTAARLALPASLATSSCQVVGRYVPITDPVTGRVDAGCLDTTYASSSLTIGSTPILDIGKWVYATSQSGTSTFTVPAGITRIKVTITGGGGAGGDGGGGPTPSGGGSAGGTSIKWYDVSATTTIQYHVGAANGDGSWFGGSFASPVMVANAGIKPTGAARGPDGGTATGGDINIVGGAGSSPGTAAGTTGGTGGASIWGGGGAAGNNTTASGNSTLVCGAGGGGGYTSTGGSGAAGCLIIEY